MCVPLEAVTAMALAMSDKHSGAAADYVYWHEHAVAALAALPAGVYRSDGQGHVTAPSAGRERATMDHLARDMRLSAKEKAIAEDFTRSYLAALSATDTKTADE